MLNNAKTRTRVLLSFGSIILLSSAIIIWLLVQMNGVAKTTQQLYQMPYTASNDMWIIRRNLVDTQRVLSKLMGVDDPSILTKAGESANKTLSADASAIQEAISNLEGLFTSQDKINLLNEIKTYIFQGDSIREQAVKLYLAGDDKGANTLITNSYDPVFESCNQKVMELFALTEQDAKNFVENAASSNRLSMVIGILLLAVGLVIAFIITVIFTESLIRPLKQLQDAANEMSRGNLKVVEKVTYQSRNEMGQLADSLRTTMTNLSSYVDEISGILLRLADGDLTVPRDQITDFLGDFSAIKSSFVRILKSFNATLGDISQSAAQVDSGANQVSSAAQGLSSGASEQASAIEELTATTIEISGQISENAENAKNANKLASQMYKEVEESNRQMQEMSAAMSEIRSSSQEIGKIIKAIEDIAFQTNILALNAAVEAARAGAAGKGFAVVADEVRNLASKSAEASKSTASLIAASVKAVENGTAIAEATARSLEAVVENTQMVSETVEKIASASARQATSVEQVTTRVEQISSVVQTNSATAEESAAASEELSSQADLLNRLVARFHLFHMDKTPVSLPSAVNSNCLPCPESNTYSSADGY